MTKFTFVVEFEDGKEPSVHAAMDILGGKLLTVVFKDDVNDRAIPVEQYLPAEWTEVLLFDANDGCWFIGWGYRCVNVNSNGWEWGTHHTEKLSLVNVTHWAELPEHPETQ